MAVRPVDTAPGPKAVKIEKGAEMRGQRQFNLIVAAIWLFAMGVSESSRAQVKKVTTYIVDVQEERRSTRWTLTEWLRIKERMKLMDLWLAMFSSPKKAEFAPELMFEYASLTGDLELGEADNDGSQLLAQGLPATQLRGQFWLTNLVSSTTGVKTLNIDLGFEAAQIQWQSELQGNDFVDQAPLGQPPWDAVSFGPSGLSWAAVTMRLFGSHVQDTSLIFKMGQYEGDRWPRLDSGQDHRLTGVVAGGESYLYLLSWLGADFDYLRFGNASGAAGSEEQSGSYMSYGGFIEIFGLRLGYREQVEQWSWQLNQTSYESTNKGSSWYARLSF
jgi:hypothetical protein